MCLCYDVTVETDKASINQQYKHNNRERVHEGCPTQHKFRRHRPFLLGSNKKYYFSVTTYEAFSRTHITYVHAMKDMHLLYVYVILFLTIRPPILKCGDPTVDPFPELLEDQNFTWKNGNQKTYKSLLKTFLNQCENYPSDRCFKHVLRFSIRSNTAYRQCNFSTPYVYLNNLPRCSGGR